MFHYRFERLQETQKMKECIDLRLSHFYTCAFFLNSSRQHVVDERTYSVRTIFDKGKNRFVYTQTSFNSFIGKMRLGIQIMFRVEIVAVAKELSTDALFLSAGS